MMGLLFGGCRRADCRGVARFSGSNVSGSRIESGMTRRCSEMARLGYGHRACGDFYGYSCSFFRKFMGLDPKWAEKAREKEEMLL